MGSATASFSETKQRVPGPIKILKTTGSETVWRWECWEGGIRDN